MSNIIPFPTYIIYDQADNGEFNQTEIGQNYLSASQFSHADVMISTLEDTIDDLRHELVSARREIRRLKKMIK